MPVALIFSMSTDRPPLGVFGVGQAASSAASVNVVPL
jgi:hypothetical protein